MGGSSKQVTGHKYFATFVGMIGNCIEGIWGWNFDNRGWIRHPKGELIKAGKFNIDRQDLYGETEGGISGFVDIKDGDPNQTSNDIYAAYLAQNDLPPVAYRYLSYLVYEDFYWGNNPYMKEVLIWPKRIHKKFDGSGQWYDEKAEIPEYFISLGGGIKGEISISIKHTPRSNDLNYIENINVTASAWNNFWDANGINPYPTLPFSFYANWVLKYNSSEPVYLEFRFNMMNNAEDKKTNPKAIFGGNIVILEELFIDEDYESNILYGKGQTRVYRCILPASADLAEAFINAKGTLTDGLVVWYMTRLRWVDPKDGEIWLRAKYGFDINPVHKIREILTDYIALNKSESDIDDDNFTRAADQIYEESLGISYAIQEAKCIDVLNDICSHIEGAVRINRQTGKYQVVLFRDDWFDLEQAQSFDEKTIKTFEAEITNADGPVNVLNINYYDRANIKNSSFNLADVGSIHTIGGEISQTVDFPYFMNRRNAEMVGNWKLKQLSTGAWKGTFTTGKYEARKINRYDVVKISFAKRGIIELLARVMNIKLGNGRDNTVSIDFVEVVPYSGQSFTTITVDPPVENALSPQPTQPIVFEMPYFEAVQQFGQSQVDLELSNNPELGYLAAAAPKPQNNSLNALLYTDGATGIYTNFERVSPFGYCQALYLDQPIDYLDTSFAVKDIDFVEQRNTQKFVNTDADTIIQLNDEIMAFVSYDAETKIISVKRGVLDTVPQKHTGGNLVFWGESIAYDSTQYVQSEIVQAQVLTTTPSAVQQLNLANVVSLEMSARAIRPYPPAAVKINNEFFPDSVDVTVNNIEIKWMDRNRLHQTGGSILSWTDSAVTKENDTTYSLELMCEDELLLSKESLTVNEYVIDKSILQFNKYHTLKIWSVRNGFDSYQKFECEFFAQAEVALSATVTKTSVFGKTAPVANVSVIVDEGLKANLKFDGTEIRGKSEPGASITIEVNDE